ncbi:MAG TPA: hypothetical protein DHM37_00895 [Candidatus Cloacimonas sp.]|jgi:adenylate cyclase|nr:hypothetical protein [Candidatus Cloacimonas sp.]
MFSDIYNFITYSEGKAPPELVTNLNQYFEKIANFVLENNRLLDKYPSDGIIALFEMPIYRANHAFSACRTALQHKKYCK